MKKIMVLVLLLSVAIILYNTVVKDRLQTAVQTKGTAVETQINGAVITQ